MKSLFSCVCVNRKEIFSKEKVDCEEKSGNKYSQWELCVSGVKKRMFSFLVFFSFFLELRLVADCCG